jgi:hypothetical protein
VESVGGDAAHAIPEWGHDGYYHSRYDYYGPEEGIYSQEEHLLEWAISSGDLGTVRLLARDGGAHERYGSDHDVAYEGFDRGDEEVGGGVYPGLPS